MRAVRRFVGGRTPFRQTAGIKTACRDLAGCFFWAKPIQAGNADAFPAFLLLNDSLPRFRKKVKKQA